MRTRFPLFLGLVTFAGAGGDGPAAGAGGDGPAAGAGGDGPAAGAGDDGGDEACYFPYYYCLDSCDAEEAQDPPVDWCHTTYEDGCPGSMVSTSSCGFCEN